MGCESRSALTATYNSLAPTSMPAASGCRTGNASHLLLPFLIMCSSDMPVGCPGARTQSKLPIEIVVGNRQTSSHVCTQPQTHAYRSGFQPGTNVGAACSCHPASSNHHRSTRVPLDPVWPKPVARLSVLISPACLSRDLSEMMDRIAKGPEDVKKSVRAADELP